jgi:hypothetical protein
MDRDEFHFDGHALPCPGVIGIDNYHVPAHLDDPDKALAAPASDPHPTAGRKICAVRKARACQPSHALGVWQSVSLFSGHEDNHLFSLAKSDKGKPEARKPPVDSANDQIQGGSAAGRGHVPILRALHEVHANTVAFLGSTHRDLPPTVNDRGPSGPADNPRLTLDDQHREEIDPRALN